MTLINPGQELTWNEQLKKRRRRWQQGGDYMASDWQAPASDMPVAPTAPSTRAGRMAAENEIADAEAPATIRSTGGTMAAELPTYEQLQTRAADITTAQAADRAEAITRAGGRALGGLGLAGATALGIGEVASGNQQAGAIDLAVTPATIAGSAFAGATGLGGPEVAALAAPVAFGADALTRMAGGQSFSDASSAADQDLLNAVVATPVNAVGDVVGTATTNAVNTVSNDIANAGGRDQAPAEVSLPQRSYMSTANPQSLDKDGQ
jgi:hypothetical protein